MYPVLGEPGLLRHKDVALDLDELGISAQLQADLRAWAQWWYERGDRFTRDEHDAFADRAEQLGDRADSVLVGAQAIVNQRTADELYETMNALQATLRAAQRTMEVYGDARRGPAAELSQTMATLRQLSARLDSTIASPALGRTLNRADTLTGNLAAMTTQLSATSERLDSLLAGVNRGQGTLGKFATDSGLYYDMRSTSQSLKRLIDELQRHPGKIGVTVKLF
jgi:phospholipid/cholesterol/gamma-HCH transport system substrate-binding protein